MVSCSTLNQNAHSSLKDVCIDLLSVSIEELETCRKSAAEGKANSNNIWNTPYLFNAKEFDEEPGIVSHYKFGILHLVFNLYRSK